MALPPNLPQFTLPQDYTSVSDWFWGDIAPIVDMWNQEAVSGPMYPTYQSAISGLGGSTASGMFGSVGGPYRIGHYSGPARAYSYLSATDQNLAQWGDWLNEDPRAQLQQYLATGQSNPAFDTQGRSGESTMLTGALSAAISREAIRQKFTDLGIPEAGINQVLGQFYDPYTPQPGATDGYRNPGLDHPAYTINSTYLPNSPLNDPTWGPLLKVFSDAGLSFDTPMGLANYDGKSVAAITDASLLTALQAAGINPTPAPPLNDVTPTEEKFTMADSTSGANPAALAPFSTFANLLGGYTLNYNDKGVPSWTPSGGAYAKYLKADGTIDTDLWNKEHPFALMGPQQAKDIGSFLQPLQKNATENWANNLLDPTRLSPGLANALGIYNNQVIPGLKELSETGFRTATPNLYGQTQYDKANSFLNNPVYGANQTDYATKNLTGPLYGQGQQTEAQRMMNSPVYRQQASTLASEMMSKGIPQATRDAAYADFNQHGAQDIKAQNVGQTGSFSTDYLGALSRGTADITNQLAKDSAAYQAQGLGISNQMSEGQRSADQQALSMLNQMSGATREAQDRSLGFLNSMSASERDAATQALGILNQMTQGQATADMGLSESAAARRAQGLPLLGSTATAAAQLPLTFGQDVMNAGGAMRLTDESMRPGGRAWDMFLAGMGGTAPGNMGYTMQGQLPSATTSLLSGYAGQSANFGNSGGSSWMNSLLSNPGVWNMAGGLLSKGLGAAWDAVSGLWGGGGGGGGGYSSDPYSGGQGYYGSGYYGLNG